MDTKPEKIGVVGAGLMGAEIGLVFALAGHDVLLSDQSEAALAGALERLERVMDRGIGRGFYKDEEKPAALARIRMTTKLDDFADCDFVTEAVFEAEPVPGIHVFIGAGGAGMTMAFGLADRAWQRWTGTSL